MANLFGLTISLLLFLTLFFLQPSLWIWNVLLTCSPHPDPSGNASDATAKNTATCPSQPLCLTYSHIHDNSPTSSLTDTQSFATLKNVYHMSLESLAIILHLHGSARMNNPDFSIFFPLHFAILTHVSQGGALKEINENWFITGFTSVAQKFCEAFLTTQVKPVKWKH